MYASDWDGLINYQSCLLAFTLVLNETYILNRYREQIKSNMNKSQALLFQSEDNPTDKGPNNSMRWSLLDGQTRKCK